MPSDRPGPPLDESPLNTFVGDPNLRQRTIVWWAGLAGNVRGAIWILLAGFLFTIMAGVIKSLGQRLHVTEILLFRQVVMTAIVAPVIIRGFPGSLKTDHPGLHAGRIIFAMTAMLAGFTAIIHIPLADATAISFARSFFITLFAIIFLKEVVGVRRWTATIVGFIGVLVMLRPTGTDALQVYGFIAAGGSAAAGMAITIIRKLSQWETPTTILSYQAIAVGLLMAPPAIWFWITPTAEEWMLLVLLGVVSYLAQYANIRAFRNGEATAIVPLDYARLVFATAIGVIIFSEWPDLSTYVGAAIIITASLYTVHREARQNRRADELGDRRDYTD